MTAKPPRAISVATYNVLADAYIKPEYYPRCDPKDFRPKNRHPRLDARVAAIGTDVICLQEVDHEAFKRFDDRLRPLGYLGRWAHKGFSKPDGCATFVQDSCGHVSWSIHELEGPDGKPSGHVALSAHIGKVFGMSVVNTHLKWDPPETPIEARVGFAQARHLILMLRSSPWVVVCGDFNATPDHMILAAFQGMGYADPHPPTLATFNAAGGPRKIDYLLHNDDLTATPSPTTLVADDTPLPSKTEPSDHVPLLATFARRT